jgi:hypothetical protein
MSLRFGPIAMGGTTALAAVLFASNDARACGGCFHAENQPETTVVTGHRMAFSISPTQTVLWDQIQYAGSPSEFAWVLPVKPGAHIELSNDAWFDALDAATSTRVAPPQLNCVFQDFEESSGQRGCGCASMSDAAAGVAVPSAGPNEPPPVTVTHQGSVGPYETVTVHANIPGALAGWLTMHSYAIDPSVQPIIDAYSAEGFDFIALRLQPGQGIQQMKPVRVVSPGAVPALPLRMVAAGTGANVDITLFVIGEGRWETQNFPNGRVDAKDLSWDFARTASNYTPLRQTVLAKESGRTWLNTYAKRSALLSPVLNPTTQSPVQYSLNQSSPMTIASLYIEQGLINGEGQTDACMSAFDAYANSAGIVVDLCPVADGGSGGGGAGGSGAGGSGGADCGTAQIGQIDARVFACGTLDDVAVAVTGMHPRDVWLTRLESNLPHAALKDDLTLQAAGAQSDVENWLTATIPLNPPCQLAAATPAIGERGGGGGTGDSRRRTETAFFMAVVAALGAAVARRARAGLVAAPVRSR